MILAVKRDCEALTTFQCSNCFSSPVFDDLLFVKFNGKVLAYLEVLMVDSHLFLLAGLSAGFFISTHGYSS